MHSNILMIQNDGNLAVKKTTLDRTQQNVQLGMFVQ